MGDVFPGVKCFYSEISILVDPKQISVVSKSEKAKERKGKEILKKGLLPPLPVVPPGPFDLVACLTFPFLFFFGGGGAENNILGGPVSSC